MPVPTSRTDLSATAASNSPSGSDVIASGTGPDDYIRQAFAFDRQNYDDILLRAPIASPTFTGTVTLPATEVGGTVALNNNIVSEVKTLSFNGVIDDGNSGTADTIDFGAGQYHKSTLTGNCTYTLTAPAGPCVVQLELIQDGTGSRTYSTSPTLLWPTAVTAAEKLLSTAAGARDLLILRWNGTDYIASLLKGIG